MIDGRNPVLLVGNNRLTFSIASCLLEAGCEVMVITEKEADLYQYFSGKSCNKITVLKNLENLPEIDLAIVITPENETEKSHRISELSKLLPVSTLIAVNSESIPVTVLQEKAEYPERVIVANWVEPVENTLFLELLGNDLSNQKRIQDFENFAINHLNKDPYVVMGELGYRSRLMASLVREAFYLIENDYATVEDIDRACRNDSGYYLPFSGNLRYMDLMGTYAYGLVMKELNPELANHTTVPGFLTELLEKGSKGMENRNGFYNYGNGEAENWDGLIRNFSMEIRELMDKYPFNYQLEQVNGVPVKTCE